MSRGVWLAVAAVSMALLAGCGGSDEPEPDRVRATLLQPGDLPGDVVEYSYPTEPGSGGLQFDRRWNCPVRTILEDTGYVQDYVAYDLGREGRVYSFRFSNANRDVASDLDDMATAWRTCDELGYQPSGEANDGQTKAVTEVDHGPGAFGFRTSRPNGDVFGETALRVVGQSIVQVTALGPDQDAPTDVSVADLLDKATARAE